jgi:hypothetical protein
MIRLKKKTNLPIDHRFGVAIFTLCMLGLAGCNNTPRFDFRAEHVVRVELLSPVVNWAYFEDPDGSKKEKRWLGQTIRTENPADIKLIVNWLAIVSRSESYKSNDYGFWKFPCRNQIVLFYDYGRIATVNISVTQKQNPWREPRVVPGISDNAFYQPCETFAVKIGPEYFFFLDIPACLQPPEYVPALDHDGYYHLCEFPIPEAWQ